MNFPLALRRILQFTALALALVVLPTSGEAQLRRLNPPTPPSRPVERIGAPATPINNTQTFTPKFEVVAETPLLMEGLLHANYKGLQKILKNKPADRETWVFARGQAILIAEGGNLLLLRPAKGDGRDPWWKLAMDLRSKATTLARAAAARDHVRSLQALAEVSQSCKRCHQTFRINVPLDVPAPAANEVETE